MSDAKLLLALRDYFTGCSEQNIEVDRAKLNRSLDAELTKSDAESLFTGLVLSRVANQKRRGRSFADYSFMVECEPAARVLETQRIARAALEEARTKSWRSQTPDAELTATFPPEITDEVLTNVRPLSDDLRTLFFGADSLVRIANPYFDPNPSVVGDIASLANRGVKTKILTRETNSASLNLVSALNSVYEGIDPPNRHRLKVRDLYERDGETGRQAYATHAKIAIADSEVCYIGSANLTDTSLSNNFELGVLLRGENVKVATEVFDTVFDFAREVKLPI
ncbi:phospholipase D-like domain-containing protein [Halalkalicoccus paucihalophilus]|uniref:phospholipase D-like domain-containing protein n=1 Tax=Halalkalicoccus paucihalophilus TaxID=1008153 RepID=UPI0014710167|nr:phospholipase D family protein [Halalkalicoccus paucihalophilus]